MLVVFFALNRALLFKWVQSFSNNPISLWVKVVKCIHGEKAFVGSRLPMGKTSVWLDILKVVNHLKDKGLNL